MRRCLVLIIFTLSCTSEPPEAVAVAGEPLPGLTTTQLQRFQAARALFDRDFEEAEGLGPLFNQRRCSSCHDIPTVGGNGSESVAKATRFAPPDRCELFEAQGGDMLQRQVTSRLAAHGFGREEIPADADAVVSLHSPPLYGLGLVEAIPEETILGNADPDDHDGNGIRGRVVRLADGRLARFGKKLRFATLRDFIADAIHQEMGITSPAFPTELTHGGRPLPDGADPAPDPEIDSATLDLLTDYVRLLAPPERQSPDIAAVADSITEGRLLFGRIGCADCHTPAMQTGASDVAALDRKTIMLYSDLLLHDMGDELASICAPHASPSEWRTAPLLGLRHRAALLHDGRTAAYRDAIEDHGGEAANARARFLSLDPGDQARLLRFLGSL